MGVEAISKMVAVALNDIIEKEKQDAKIGSLEDMKFFVHSLSYGEAKELLSEISNYQSEAFYEYLETYLDQNDDWVRTQDIDKEKIIQFIVDYL